LLASLIGCNLLLKFGLDGEISEFQTSFEIEGDTNQNTAGEDVVNRILAVSITRVEVAIASLKDRLAADFATQHPGYVVIEIYAASAGIACGR